MNKLIRISMGIEKIGVIRKENERNVVWRFLNVIFTKIMNKRGPSRLPWGTPQVTGAVVDSCPFTITNCFGYQVSSWTTPRHFFMCHNAQVYIRESCDLYSNISIAHIHILSVTKSHKQMRTIMNTQTK